MIDDANKNLDEALEYLHDLVAELRLVNSGNLSHHIASINALARLCIILIEQAKLSIDESESRENGYDARGQHHAQGQDDSSVG